MYPLSVNRFLSTRQRTVYNWFPIYEETLSDVLAWHWVNAVRLHPVYIPAYHKDGTTGGYLKTSVLPGLHLFYQCRSPGDLSSRQAAFDLISNLERKLHFTMRPGASLVQIVEARPSALIEEERQQSFCF